MSEVISMITALSIIAIILLSSGSRLYLRRRFERKIKPHLDALERASKKNAEIKTGI